MRSAWVALELSSEGEDLVVSGRLAVHIRSDLGVPKTYPVIVPAVRGSTVSALSYVFIREGLPPGRYLMLERKGYAERVLSRQVGNLRTVSLVSGKEVDAMLRGSARVEGPRLKELYVQASSPGAFIPRVWGAARIGGQVIWASDFEEEVATIKASHSKEALAYLQIEITGALPSSRQLSPRRMQTMCTLGFSAPTPETPNWWMVVDPQSLEHAASAVMRALLMVLEVLPQRLAEALTNWTQPPQEPRPAQPDVVGSMEIPDEDGQPTGVSLLLTRGMDAAGLAETFKADRRVDMDSGAIIRRPGEADDAFAARIQAVIDDLVAVPGEDPTTYERFGD